MLVDEFMQRMLKLFPEAEIRLGDDDRQVVILTGWFQDPDDENHFYTDGSGEEWQAVMSDG
jgi:hypothetical protein